MSDEEFGDIEPDDTYSEGDEEIDWSQVDRVDSQISSIQAIEDDDERLEAARNWAVELRGDA